MRLRAKDTVHISAVQSDNLVEGDEFELEDAEGQKLIDRGIAELVDAAPPSPPAPPKPVATPPRQNKGKVSTEKKG